MKLIKEQDSPLLDRKTVYFESTVNRNRTPSRAEVKAQLSTILKAKPELIAIKKIQHLYGQSKVTITANIYKNIEMLRSLEVKKKKESPKEKKEEKKEMTKEKKEEGKTEKEDGKKTETKEQNTK